MESKDFFDELSASSVLKHSNWKLVPVEALQGSVGLRFGNHVAIFERPASEAI